MNDSTAAAPAPTNFKRLLVIVAVGLGSINAAQLGLAVLANRACSQQQHHALSVEATSDRFHNFFYKNPNTIEQNLWMGIRTSQNPNDVWITQEILFEVKPDFVIETGTYMGGSAVMWASILREINPSGRVITIDIADRTDEAKRLPIFRERVDFLLGGSTAPEIVSEVKRRVAGRRAVVVLDSDHRRHHVLDELRAYADIVPVGSYIIVQDSNINGHPVVIDPGGRASQYAGLAGPMEAIEEFLSTDKRFESDVARERLMLTICPKGYLRRVR